MRAFLTTLVQTLALTLAALTVTPARSGDDIRSVLLRSQQMQLDALMAQQVSDQDPRAEVIHASFDRVLNAVNVPSDIRLIVVRTPLLAVCLMGRVVAVNVGVADLSEAERTFVLAHEVGHVAYSHWAQLGDLYQDYIPGTVSREHTDAVAAALGRDATQLMHRHEFEADAFAFRLLRRLGESDDTPVVLFQEHLPFVVNTATHPGTQQRIAQLRSLR